MTAMRLTKHHGLGNDFLVIVDPDDHVRVDGALALSMCDRHRGIGADGLIRVGTGGAAPFRMELYNEDGTRAEMSGNGISCLAQAVVRAGLAPDGAVSVETDAGIRVVTVVEETSSTHHRMRVAMGSPRLGEPTAQWAGHGIRRAVHVDVGNPHLVCEVDQAVTDADLRAFGSEVNAAVPGGINVELVVVPTPESVSMQVYERGVGPTQACGTGAVAVAVATAAWGLTGDLVTVVQPGGAAEVELDHIAHLVVPVVAVAEVEWLG